jgi:hypothetical protein
MPVKVSLDQASARRGRYVTPGGAVAHISTYIGTNKMELLAQGRTTADGSPAGPSGPMAYLVDQSPGATVDPHFHEVRQFQLFIGGDGRVGTHALEGVVVHYAGAHSPYGPIVAGPKGVQYVTLRPDWDPGAQWMPGAAPVLRALPNRRHDAFTSPPLQRRDPAPMQGTVCTEVMPRREDGVGAWLVHGAPGQGLPVHGAGVRFCYVLAGSVDDGRGELGAGGCLHFAADEAPGTLTAGAAGAEVIQVSFGTK